MKKVAKGKLNINKSTVRVLTDDQLSSAAGGTLIFTQTCFCWTTQSKTCTADQYTTRCTTGI